MGFLVGICLALVGTAAFAGRALWDRTEGGAAWTPEKINLNDAPLVSLLRLPGVGLTRARAIVDYRRGAAGPAVPGPVFASGEDVQRVKGFGPATVKEILPWLQLPAAPEKDGRASDAD